MHNLHNDMKSVAAWLLSIVLIAVFAGGCAGPRPFPPLEQARDAYLKAKSDPQVEALAPVAMYEAKTALEKAEAAKKMEAKEHLSYLAEKRARIAMAEAERKNAENEYNRLEREKESVILESRRVEAEQAQLRAEKSTREAQQAREEAIRLRQETEISSREAQEARQEALRLQREAEARAREVSEARERAGRLESEMSELKAKRTDRGIVLTLGDVLFATNQSDLTAGAARTVDKLSEFLKKYPDRTLQIEGHTDNTGNDQYNQFLSEQRAQAVKTALLQRGISADRMTAVGYGEARPVAPNDTSLGRQQNRRVEIVISEGSDQPVQQQPSQREEAPPQETPEQETLQEPALEQPAQEQPFPEPAQDQPGGLG